MIGQADFVDALLDPDLPVPQGLVGRSRQPTRRFSVYRNNVVAGLIDAMSLAFPVIRKLVGGEFFKAMAGIHVREFPPKSPLLMHYGADFPDFLSEFPPAKQLPYLPDVARLELIVRESYHEQDAEAVGQDAVLSLTPGDLAAARIAFAPSVRLMRSAYPVCGIWKANMKNASNPEFVPEDVLVVRKGYDPEPAVLPKGGYEMMLQLMDGKALAQACEHAETVVGDAPLADVLALLVPFGAIVSVDSATISD